MKKQKTKFVQRMEAIDKLLVNRLLWASYELGTYVKAKHGKLK